MNIIVYWAFFSGAIAAFSLTLGSLVGFVLGAIYYTLIYHSGNKGLLYFEEFQSNNVLCKRPRKNRRAHYRAAVES